MSENPHRPAAHVGGHGAGSLTRVGGGVGIAASVVGLAIFLGACSGFEASLRLSFLPLVLGLVGLVLAVIGGARQHNPQDTHVMAAIFPNILGIVGGLAMMAPWLGWTVFVH